MYFREILMVARVLLFVIRKWHLVKYTWWKIHIFAWSLCKILNSLFFNGLIVIFGAKSAFFLHSFCKEKHKFCFWRFILTLFCIQAELNLMSLHVTQAVRACLLWWDCSQGSLQLFPDCFQTQEFYGSSYWLKVTSLFVFYFDSSGEMKFLNYKDI